ncbi:hypothetical protein RB195_005037 [Necator americanus]|uniref:Uncharacterized protein n=1 Tax=Necator americanus TaxID=51031 RepID=A0ABR1BKX9_NECAM
MPIRVVDCVEESDSARFFLYQWKRTTPECCFSRSPQLQHATLAPPPACDSSEWVFDESQAGRVGAHTLRIATQAAIARDQESALNASGFQLFISICGFACDPPFGPRP